MTPRRNPNVGLRHPAGDGFQFDSLWATGILVTGLVYAGANLEYLAISVSLLCLWFLKTLLRIHAGTPRIPWTPISLAITGWWLWIAVSTVWSHIPSISAVYIWILGGFPLMFWVYTLNLGPESAWKHILLALLSITLLLACYAAYQFFVLRDYPTSFFGSRNSHAAFMNLLLLPAVALFLSPQKSHKSGRLRVWVLPAAVFVITYSVALTTSRGAILSLMAGLLVLVAVAARHVSRHRLLLLAILLPCAYLLGSVSSASQPAEAQRPLLDATNRLLIWEPAWRLLLERPFWGIGAGNFSFVWPPFKNPHDTSVGVFVHNDYLQYWIELGLPGLLLTVAIMVLVLRTWWRLVRNTAVNTRVRIEATGIFSALLAVAIHSFVDFNLYVLSILLVVGLLLGRLHQLALAHSALHIYPPIIRKHRAILATKLVMMLMCLLPLPYLAGLGAGERMRASAVKSAQEGYLEAADRDFRLAERLSPFDASIFIGHADVLRYALPLFPNGAAPHRHGAYLKAMQLLNKAEEMNPLRADISVIRGNILSQNPDLAGVEWRALSIGAYRKALDINPKLYKTRMQIFQILIRDENSEDGLRVLTDGLRYLYPDNSALVPYYKLTLRHLIEAERANEANALQKKLAELEQRLATTPRTYELHFYGY